MNLNRALSENEIQVSILEFLRFKKIVAWRNNNGGTYDPTASKFRRKNPWEKIHGDPVDILGILPDGKFLAIEVKRDSKSRPSKGQKQFLSAISEAGGISFVAFSLNCVKTALSDYF